MVKITVIAALSLAAIVLHLAMDEFMHISRRMRGIALQSAVGGMALSAVGMIIAAAALPPSVIHDL